MQITFKVPVPAAYSVPEYVTGFIIADRFQNAHFWVEQLKIRMDSVSSYPTRIVPIDKSFSLSKPYPLPWSLVDELLANDTGKVLIVLEDIVAGHKSNPFPQQVTVKDANGKTSVRTSNTELYYSEVTWRIYDARHRLILDEFKDQVSNMYVMKDSSLNMVPILASADYRNHILPHFLYVDRELFISGSNKLKKAGRLFKDLHPEPAFKLWDTESKSRNRLSAGKALFNMAIYMEAQGHVDEAVNFMTRSMESGNKKAQKYLVFLRQHKKALDQLHLQPGNK